MNKTVTIVSGFSCTLKSSHINQLEGIKFYSPVKPIADIEHKFFKDGTYLNPLHYFYAQYYAVQNDPRIYENNVVIERGIWDFMHYFFSMGYYNETLYDLPDIDYKGMFEHYTDLLPEHIFKALLLYNDSERLLKTAINGEFRTRAMIYSSIDEYKKKQDDYFQFITRVIGELKIPTEIIRITDQYIDDNFDWE